MTRAFRLGDVAAALAALFPPDVAVAAEIIGPADTASLWPAERTAIAGSVPARRDEFAAGRTAARRALAALGEPPAELPVGLDRAPVWPTGLFGSISHSSGVAAAALRRSGPLGLDIEEDAPIEPALWPMILQPDELSRLPEENPGRWVRQVFAAKEAVFKAQPPEHRVLFGFEAVEIRLDDKRFEARFRQPVGAFSQGFTMPGRLEVASGLILAGVCR
jgi:4'-phosphopantetheinyl transferase EntD